MECRFYYEEMSSIIIVGVTDTSYETTADLKYETSASRCTGYKARGTNFFRLDATGWFQTGNDFIRWNCKARQNFRFMSFIFQVFRQECENELDLWSRETFLLAVAHCCNCPTQCGDYIHLTVIWLATVETLQLEPIPQERNVTLRMDQLMEVMIQSSMLTWSFAARESNVYNEEQWYLDAWSS